MSSPIFIDGDWSKPSAISPLLGESPFAGLGDGNEYIFRQTFQQARSKFKVLPIGANGPNGARLVEETPRMDVGGYAVQWTRVWALVPKRQKEVGDTVHLYSEEINGTTFIDPRPTRATYIHDFFYAPGDSFEGIGLYRAEKITSAGGVTIIIPQAVETMNGSLPFGSAMKPIAFGSNYKVSVDSSLRQWMGPIWQRTTPIVRQISFADYLT